MGRATISAVIPTKNVGAYVGVTLESLRFCDEVIIVDMFSTDNTRAICESFPNVRFFERNDYIYGNFNFGAEQAKSDWILRLDSDEVITPELRDSILSVLSAPTQEFSHYDAECHLYICGMRLHGGYGEAIRTTIYRKGTAHYLVQGEHEGLIRQGPAGRLAGHYDHFSVPTIANWIQKYNYYTSKDAERMPLQPPEKWWKTLWHAVNHFRGSYFGKGKLRQDGYLGFAVAVLAAFGQILLQIKVWERWERDRLKAAGLMPSHPNAGPAPEATPASK